MNKFLIGVLEYKHTIIWQIGFLQNSNKGVDMLFFYLLKSFLFQIMCYPHCPFVNNIC